MGFPEWGTAPIKCAKRGCGWRGFETELDAEDGRQDMTTQSICPECGCHDYYFMTEKEVAKWERDKAKNKVPNGPHEGPCAASSRTVPLDAVVGNLEQE